MAPVMRRPPRPNCGGRSAGAREEPGGTRRTGGTHDASRASGPDAKTRTTERVVAEGEQIEVRVDRWLSAARIFKSRTQATLACVEGEVRINGEVAKPSHTVKVGDKVSADAPRGCVVLEITALSDKRLAPALARELYVDRSPPESPREGAFADGSGRSDRFPLRERGAGRPTKVERRAVERFRGR